MLAGHAHSGWQIKNYKQKTYASTPENGDEEKREKSSSKKGYWQVFALGEVPVLCCLAKRHFDVFLLTHPLTSEDVKG